MYGSQPTKERILSRTHNPLITLPIAQRLVLGFLIPALIAALASSIIGIQSMQLLSQESAFYQNLFQSYSSLTTGNNFLQLMDFQMHTLTTDATASNSSPNQLATDQKAEQGLATRYDVLLHAYVQRDLLIQHPEHVALFDQAGHAGLAAQQSALASSALRTWNVYHDAQSAVFQQIQHGNAQAAQAVEHAQGELTYFDALSALRQLIQFDGRLTAFVQDATALQGRNQLITTLVAIVLVLLGIGLMGGLIYGTLVRRLQQLQRVAQAVQEGHLTTRIMVDGRDEITAVSASVNTMLDTMVGLLDETRMQRDALIQAAKRLFSDIRLANGSDFDVSTAVTNDPIGMLGNAFHFTVGRFRRFVLRTQRTIEPLEAISQQEMELATTFVATARHLLREGRATSDGTGISVQEITRLTEGFAQEVTMLAQRLRGITQEMHASLTPFRLEVIERSQRFTESR